MYDLECGQCHNNCYYYKNARIICTVPSGLGIVKRRQKLHVPFFRFLTYKIDLPFSVIKPKVHTKWGEN